LAKLEKRCCQIDWSLLHMPVGQAQKVELVLYTPFPMPNCPWQDVSMDFVLGLLCTLKKYDSYVVVGCSSKMARFILCAKTSNASKVAKIYLNEIVKLYGLPKIIVSDRDVRFMSYF
jgi:hypothetical protein